MSGLAESPWLMEKDNLLIMKITLSAMMKLVINGGINKLGKRFKTLILVSLRMFKPATKIKKRKFAF